MSHTVSIPPIEKKQKVFSLLPPVILLLMGANIFIRKISTMKKRMFALSVFYVFLSGCGGPVQPSTPKVISPVGGGCDGCELMYVDMPQQIASIDSSPAWSGNGQPFQILGKVLARDGITPAPGVVIYYWQTDNEGYYANRPELDARASRHGYIRGWVKTGGDGLFTIYTIRPAPYPNDVLPAHIHLSIKEPQISNEYYTDEINFRDDPLLAPYLKKHPAENRGGSGVVEVINQKGIQIAQHTIVLGLNIPGYPADN